MQNINQKHHDSQNGIESMLMGLLSWNSRLLRRHLCVRHNGTFNCRVFLAHEAMKPAGSGQMSMCVAAVLETCSQRPRLFCSHLSKVASSPRETQHAVRDRQNTFLEDLGFGLVGLLHQLGSYDICFFREDFGKEFPSRTLWRGASGNCPISKLCAVKCAMTRAGKGVARRCGQDWDFFGKALGSSRHQSLTSLSHDPFNTTPLEITT